MTVVTVLVCMAINAYKKLVIGKKLGDIYEDFGGFWRDLTSETQLRWVQREFNFFSLIFMLRYILKVLKFLSKFFSFPLKLGPEKGVVHLAVSAIINSLWDLWGRVEGKVSGILLLSLNSFHFIKQLL